MEAITVVGCVAVAIFCAAQMLRPVSRSEKAFLVHIAEGDVTCESLADRLVAKKWLTWTEYDGAKQTIERHKAHLENSNIIAKSAARKTIRDARLKP